MSTCTYPLMTRKLFFQFLMLVCLACAFSAAPLLAHMEASEEIKQISSQIHENPKDPYLYLQRGELYRMQEHWSEALLDFDTAHQLDHKNVLAKLGMGNTWLDQGDYQQALEHFDGALAQQPENVRVRVARAKAWRLGGEPLAAATEYEHVIDLFVEPDDPLPEYYLGRARALEAAGAAYYDVALETLDAGCVRLGNIRVLQDYAIALERRRGNYAGSLRRLDQIIDTSPRKEALLLTRGDILLQNSEREQAQLAYAAALAAIDALPTRHRNSRNMMQLREELESRSVPLEHSAIGG